MSGGTRPWLPPLAACIVLILGLVAVIGVQFLQGPLVAVAYADLPAIEQPLPPPAPVERPRPGSPAVLDPTASRDEGPWLGIVVVGLGLAREPTRATIDLPAEIGLAFSPYAADLNRWLAEAVAAGHEVYLELPAEPADTALADAGPKALRVASDRAANRAVLDWVAGRGPGVVGLAIDAGGFAAEPEAFVAVARDISGLNLGLIQLGGAQLAATAESVSLPFADATGPLDEILDPVAVDEALANLELRARAGGSAIGYVRPYPLSLDRLAAWCRGLRARGLSLAPPGRRLLRRAFEVRAG